MVVLTILAQVAARLNVFIEPHTGPEPEPKVEQAVHVDGDEHRAMPRLEVNEIVGAFTLAQGIALRWHRIGGQCDHMPDCAMAPLKAYNERGSLLRTRQPETPFGPSGADALRDPVQRAASCQVAAEAPIVAGITCDGLLRPYGTRITSWNRPH